MPTQAVLRQVSVRDYRIVRLRARGRSVRVDLREHRTADTAARPLVRVRSHGRNLSTPARDAARPVLLGARLMDGKRGHIVTRWSEWVDFHHRPGRMSPFMVLSTDGRSVAPRVLEPRSKRLTLAAEASPVAVTYLAGRRFGSVRDRIGNRARPTAAVSVRKGASASEGGASGPLNMLENPIDTRQQLELEFGDRSHWLQPWRGYLETMPASKMTSRIGIAFNPPSADQAAWYAKILSESGIRRARVEIGWGLLGYDNPEQLRGRDELVQVLRALHDNGIRPMILLTSHPAQPTPARFFEVEVVAPAGKGARQVELDQASAAQVVPGKTGINSLDGAWAAKLLLTSVHGTTATLGKPLPHHLQPGTYRAATLRHEPFDRPGTPRFEQTMDAWLDYVETATRFVKSVLGGEQFDVEIWNETTWSSHMLNLSMWRDDVAAYDIYHAGTTAAVAARTVAWIRNPVNGVSRVGVTNGFTSQLPWPSGTQALRGLTALSKHPYSGPFESPGDVYLGPGMIRPINALFEIDGREKPFGSRHFVGAFEPSYRAHFPESFLSGIHTEHLVRDISPLTTRLYGTPHGRKTHPPGGSPPEVWITEVGMDLSYLPDPARVRRLQQKATLRYVTSWLNKGLGAMYLFAMADEGWLWGLVDRNRFDGGDTMVAIGRLTQAMQGPVGEIKPLSLLAIGDRHNQRQFEGDGTAAHRPLYNREVLAFLPFQTAPGKYTIPVYVMTRDITKEIPPAPYQLTIGGVPADAAVRASDPITGQYVPVSVVSRQGTRLIVELGVADYPRLLIIG